MAGERDTVTCEPSEIPPVTVLPETEHKVPAPEQNLAVMDLDDTGSLDTGVKEMRGLRLLATMVGLCLAVFCVALDNTIIATAIPHITDQFTTVQDVGWYGSAYFLTTCVCQPVYGTFYTIFNIKRTFLLALGLFEVGSLVCATSQSSAAFVVGRAVAGLGAAGVISGPLVMIARILPLEKRPQYSAFILAMFGVASVAGPLMGGALSDRATWRWCFYINLPVGAVTTVSVLVLLSLPKKEGEDRKASVPTLLRKIDFLGMILFIASTVCLLLALQWGGTTYRWSNARIIVLFVLWGCFGAAFAIVQVRKGNSALVPLSTIAHRSMVFGCLFAFCIGASFFLFVYYLPLWFQAVDGVSAERSGIDNLPLLLSQVMGTVISGAVTSKTGHSIPFVFASVIFMAVGSGLMTTFSVGMATGRWIGYQIIFGLGVGFGFQQAQLAAQAILPTDVIAIGTAVVLLVQLLGGAIFLSVGQNVFVNHLVDNLVSARVPGLDPSAISKLGVTQFRHAVPSGALDAVVLAYAHALTKTFQAGLIISCIGLLGALGMEWKPIGDKTAIGGGM